jgi:hypothetical protein
MKIELKHSEPIDNSIEELSKTLIARFGLIPRKKDATAQFHKLILELYERKKQANKEKKPEIAVMPVEEMGLFAGIKRQTMYDYLRRWLDIQVLKKTSFVANGKVVIGYELNGTNIENAFRKAEYVIKNNIEQSFKLIDELQNEIKKEKIKAASQTNKSEEHQDQQHSL